MSDDRRHKPSQQPNIFPEWLNQAQLKFLNPLMKPIAHVFPGTSLIKHRGRKSGKQYSTVVTSYRKGDTLTVALGHGGSDWVKNVLAAGEADVVRFGRTVHVVNPRVIPVGGDAVGLPWRVRVQGRHVALLVSDIA